jgi:hypothetical protein
MSRRAYTPMLIVAFHSFARERKILEVFYGYFLHPYEIYLVFNGTQLLVVIDYTTVFAVFIILAK